MKNNIQNMSFKRRHPCLLTSFLMIIFLCCSCSRKINESDSIGLTNTDEDGSVHNATVTIDKCSEKVKNAPLWKGTVQIGDLVVPCGEVPLSAFEERGYSIQEYLSPDELSYDDVMGEDPICIAKDGLEIEVYLLGVPGETIYRDSFVRYVYFMHADENCDIPVWVCNGVQFGDDISQVSCYDNISTGWIEQKSFGDNIEYKLNFLTDLDGNAIGFNGMSVRIVNEHQGSKSLFPIWGPPQLYLVTNSDNIIRAYYFECGDYAGQEQHEIVYSTETYTLDNGATITCPTIVGNRLSYRDRYAVGESPTYSPDYAQYATNMAIYENNESFAFVTLTLLQDNEMYGLYDSDLAYRGDNYSVYLSSSNRGGYKNIIGQKSYYALVRDDDINKEYAVNFSLKIWDNSGVVIPEYIDDDVYEMFTDNVNLQTDHFANSYALSLAIDIFDHIAQYSVQ